MVTAVERTRKWKLANPEKVIAQRLRGRQRVLDAYGGQCVCCGETDEAFLGIDHINGGGNRHRAEIGGGGNGLYLWLGRHGYPAGFQVFCHNCNQAKSRPVGCPHQKV